MDFSKYKGYFTIVLLTIIPTLLFWLIFSLNLPPLIGFGDVSLKTIFANYDGPNYLVIAKCGYSPDCIRRTFSLPQPLEYYPAHLPGYPLMIKALDTVLPGPLAMVLVTLFGSIFLNLAFYRFTKSLWLTFVFTLFPGRLFILRVIGAPETWFIGAILWSIISYKDKKYFPSALLATLSLTLKSPGIILFAVYGLLFLKDLLTRQKISHYLPYLLVPLTGLAIFYKYFLDTGNFWAYFTSGDNFHLNPLPFLTFISTKSWINGIWLEDILYVFFFTIVASSRLWGKFRFSPDSLFPILFTLATLLVAHRDISRYISPVYPFILIAFAPHFSTKAFRFAFLLLVPAIYLYAINFVIGNTGPVADWTPYL